MNVDRLEKEKQEEIGNAEKARISYEAKIKDLESQIEMLKSQSGDLVNQLQEKIKQMMDQHDKEKTQMKQEHED